MAANDKSEGPQIGQMVQYNNGGTIVPAIIYSVPSPGVATVGLVFFTSGGATANTVSPYNPALVASSWAYPQFF
jgi:hypothetical protein